MKKAKLLGTLPAIITAMILLYSCSGENNKALTVGGDIASFSAADLRGRTYSLASYKGRPVIIRFFLLDCPKCKANTPVFNKFYNKFRQQGLEIFYINNNGTKAADVQTFSSSLGIEFPVIFDPEGKIAKLYNIKVQPLTLVLSPEQKLLAALLGEVSEQKLHELLGHYLL